MRPRITYRDQRLKQVYRGTPAADDSDLDPELARYIGIWRTRFARVHDPCFLPSSQSIKATLGALANEADGRIDAALKSLDPASLMHLKRGARLAAPRERIRWVDNGGRLRASPRVREFARIALETFPRLESNPHRISGYDLQFACGLVRHWGRIHADDPAQVANPAHDPSQFEQWSWEMFGRAGRRSNRAGGAPLHETSLRRILSRAIREVLTAK